MVVSADTEQAWLNSPSHQCSPEKNACIFPFEQLRSLLCRCSQLAPLSLFSLAMAGSVGAAVQPKQLGLGDWSGVRNTEVMIWGTQQIKRSGTEIKIKLSSQSYA